MHTSSAGPQPVPGRSWYWAEAVSSVYLEGALGRAWACRPEALLNRRAQRAQRQEELAKAAAAVYEQAAAAARAAAAQAKHTRRNVKAGVLAERAAAARAAAVLQARAAAAARAEAARAELKMPYISRAHFDNIHNDAPVHSSNAPRA